ncbi:MAG TPA: ParA family protein [Beijerinckiaceae bacterium]|jgi:chromosome partitioning protein|nr:ParA family protein [Beijerinckiaceae bacterium]
MALKLDPFKLVSFIGQKGGVGKSALARVLAVSAARLGRNVLLADFDLEQLTCLEWNAARLRHEVSPEIDVRSYKSLKRLRKSVESFDFIIADTRGLADQLTQDVAEESDVVFLPTGTSNDDLRPTLGLARQLAKHGAGDKLTLILSKTGRSERQLDAAIAQIELAGFQTLPVSWPLRDGFQSDFDVGRAGSETSNPHLKKIAECLEQAMLERVGLS